MSIWADKILDAVDIWAYGSGWWMLRETGIAVSGRSDGLLIPVNKEADCMKEQNGRFFARPRICGVECKATRSDFLRGLNDGQFERYQKTLNGVYVASLRDVCKTAELPEGIGHRGIPNDVADRSYRCVCRRHPTYRDVDMDQETPWRIMWELRSQFTKAQIKQGDEYRKKLDQIGTYAQNYIFSAVRELEKRVVSEMEIAK